MKELNERVTSENRFSKPHRKFMANHPMKNAKPKKKKPKYLGLGRVTEAPISKPEVLKEKTDPTDPKVVPAILKSQKKPVDKGSLGSRNFEKWQASELNKKKKKISEDVRVGLSNVIKNLNKKRVQSHNASVTSRGNRRSDSTLRFS